MGAGTVGILLAGGRGARLGAGVPKALAVVGDVTLLERAIRTLARVGDAVVVAAPRALDLPLPVAAPETRVPVRRALDAGEGPLAGLVAALGVMRFERAVVLGVDFPLMRAEALATLAARLAYAGAGEPAPPAVVPAPDGVLQPLAAAYGWSAAEALAEAYGRGERSFVRAVESLGPRVLGPEALAALPGGLENFFNLNTPEDRDIAERRLRERVESP